MTGQKVVLFVAVDAVQYTFCVTLTNHTFQECEPECDWPCQDVTKYVTQSYKTRNKLEDMFLSK